MNWLDSLSKFPEFFWGEKYGECISQLLLCNKQAHTQKISVADRKSIYLALTSPGLCWSQVDCSVHASGAGWRWADLSGAWLNIDSSALMAMFGAFHFSLQVCLIFPGPANYPGCVYVMREEVQEGRLHCKSQICVISTKIPLAKASLWLILKWRDGSYMGGLQSHIGRGGVKNCPPKCNLSQCVGDASLHCSESISGPALPLGFHSVSL